MPETVVAYGGALLPISSLEITLGYTAGFVTSQTCDYQGITYVQTITRDGSGNTLDISQWIPQSLQENWLKLHEIKKEKNGWGTTVPLLPNVSADQWRAMRHGALKKEELGKI